VGVDEIINFALFLNFIESLIMSFKDRYIRELVSLIASFKMNFFISKRFFLLNFEKNRNRIKKKKNQEREGRICNTIN
jgi:uncharacterized membrane protein